VSIAVLTAVTDAAWEADFVAAGGVGDDLHVVRRCVDLADLLAAAAAGLGRVAVVSLDLRRLDGEALTGLAVAGVAVVGLCRDGDADADRRAEQLGIRHVVRSGEPPAEVLAAVAAAVAVEPPTRAEAVRAHAPQLEPPAPGGQVIAVWGPAGAPGRSSVALNVAAELAALGVETLLVDADVYGGVQAQLVGLLDEAPGLAAACRLANNGTLDGAALAELAVRLRPGLRLLTGISRADRWPEIRPSGLAAVLGLAREIATVTVADVGFCLEQDEELSFDTVAPRRNGATVAALESADSVLLVAAGDPVGLQRAVRGRSDLADVVPGVEPVTVVNRVRAAAVGARDPHRDIAEALERFAGLTDVRFVPLDVDAFDRALGAGRTLDEVAPASPARQALQSIAASLVGRAAPVGRRGLLRRR
jgi:MinD-like ATPase involved in chromosome partitioning or flagellar assembly